MKIALLCDDSLDATDGVQQYVLTLGVWLSSAGHEVHYLTSTTKRTDIPHMHSLAGRIKTRFNSNHGGMPLPAPKKKLQMLLHKEQFDIIHIQMPYSPLLAGRVISVAPTATKIIGTFHIYPQSSVVAAATRILGFWVRPQLKRFSKIMSVSRAAQDFAEKSFKIDTTVIPNMVDVARFPAPHFRQNALPIRIVFLGRLVERKGSIYLVKAIQHLLQANPQYASMVTVIIAGKGPLLGELQAYVAKHDLSAVVSFPGFIAEADKPCFLADADIAVFPSTGGESFGISLIEAMAATPGPVVAGDNPGYRTVMEGAESQLVQPSDTVAFARLLQKYIDDDTARHQVHVWQTQYVRQYDTPVVGHQILQVYEDALRLDKK